MAWIPQDLRQQWCDWTSFSGMEQQISSSTLPKTNIFAPENCWLEFVFPFEKAYFQVRTVSFR